MNILIAGDLHFNKNQYQWLADQKEYYDCLCLTGDLLNGDSDDFTHQSEWVATWLKEFDKYLVICSGNHDLDEFAECDWLTHINSKKICRDNQIKIFNGIKFGSIPYLGADLSYFSDCDVLLNHVPPVKTGAAQSNVDGSLKDWGDEGLYYALKERVISPRYIFCGHVENPSANRDCIFGVEIINPGAQHNSSTPNHEYIAV